MRSLGLRLSLLFLATVPLACGQSSNGSGSGGNTGGSDTGGASAVGGSGPKGGSGGGTTATGGNAGSGGSTGGATGQGGVGGVGGSAPGGTGGSQPGGAGSGTGGTGPGGAPGGAGGTSHGDGSAGATGGTIDGGGGDAIPVSTCTNKKADGDETDTDCGGGTCPKCDGGKVCKQDSDCKSASCDSGKCVDPFDATGTITSSTDNRTWTITLGTTVLAVQVAGAKIVTYSLDGTNFLVGAENGGSFGSVFWIAPQSEWNASGWPPPSEMDENATFTASSKDNVLTMSIAAGTDGLSISKRFWGNAKFQTVTMEYTFKNSSSAAVKKAPWEITRVFPGGLTFFPTAETPVKLVGTCNCFLEIPFTTSAGVAWWKYQKSTFTQDVKGGANGSEGWAAHVNCGTGLEQACTASAKSMVLIKEWADSATEAPGEKEIELYANAGHNYVEFEQQGDYQSVPAGGSVVWTMHWMLRYLPSNLAPTPGSADLVDWVRKQLL